MNQFSQLILFVAILFSVSSCKEKGKSKNQINIFAAASLYDVMNELATDFEKQEGVKLRMNFASSGVLARQIESGADCDYYISASKKWMDYVEGLQILDDKTTRALAQNSMVAIVPIDSKLQKLDSLQLHSLPQVFEGRISIGDPSHVPAGRYAKEIITHFHWDEALRDRYLPAKDVRDALFMVEMGELEMGMVYASDAMKSKKVRIVHQFSSNVSSQIAYYGISCKNSTPKVKKWMKYLQSDRAKAIWKKNSFKFTE